MGGAGARITVAALTHDLVERRSLVTLVWDEVPDERVTLPVAYGCGLDSIEAEAEAALIGFAAELAGLRLRAPEGDPARPI